METELLIGSILLIFSIFASKTGFRFGVPVLIIFLAVGMLAGEDGLGIQFNDASEAQITGTVALCFILFSGGLDTDIKSVKPVFWKGLSLSTIGVLLTTVFVGLFAYHILKFPLIEACLLGAVVSSTDASAVFSIIRGQKIGLKRHLKDVIELESASNDPMAYLLTISLIALAKQPDMGYAWIIPNFIKQMVIGTGCGFAVGYLFVHIINKIKLEADGLYPVLVVAVNIFVYSFTTVLSGNGFLAVYICAVILGNNNVIHKHSLKLFYDGFAWLMQIMMFITLGLLMTPHEMIGYIIPGVAVSLFLMFIARPLAVLISLAPFIHMKFKDKIFVSWCGLRGAVPIVFATYPLLANVGNSDTIFNMVFHVTVTSVIIQGMSLSKIADWLKISRKEIIRPKFNFNDDDDFASQLQEIVVDDPTCHGKRIMDLNLPEGALIVYVKRDRQYITPKGSTRVSIGDKILILATDDRLANSAYNILSKDKFELNDSENGILSDADDV